MDIALYDLRTFNKFRHVPENNLPWTDTDIFGIIRQMARGLAAAEFRGIGHRDVKPMNFLFSEQFKIFQLADFGESVILGPGETDNDIVGTPNFMAPELKKAYEDGD